MNTVEDLEGVEVYGADQIKLGKVKRVFSADPGPGLSRAADATPEIEDDDTSAAVEQAASGGLVFADAGLSGGTDLGDSYAPAADEDTDTDVEIDSSETKYLEVHHGGHFGIGGESLYVPFSAIKLIEQDGSVLLRCSSAEAGQRYAQPPHPLDESADKPAGG